MTPADQHALREALARAEAERDAAREDLKEALEVLKDFTGLQWFANTEAKSGHQKRANIIIRRLDPDFFWNRPNEWGPF